MKSRTHFLSSTCMAVVLAFSTMPCTATDELRVDESELPVIRVIVDHEAQLALVPKGTILPEGFQVYASLLNEDANLAEAGRTVVETKRPLVFAYAPTSRFSKLQVTKMSAEASKAVMEISGADRGEASAAKGGNPCPAVFIVEFGPEMVHQVTCRYEYAAPRNELAIPWVTYPTGARSATLGMLVDYAPPFSDFTSRGICGNGICYGAGVRMYLPTVSQATYYSNTTVRLQGPCTQDPPFCPIYSSTIAVPILEP